MPTYPKTRLSDLARLVGVLVKTLIGRGDIAEAAAGWLRRLTRRYRSPNLVIDLIVRRVLFVSGSDLSGYVLAAPPSDQAFVEGTMKRKAMAFLAPNALTISHGAQWRALRAYNEDVLNTGGPNTHWQPFLAHVVSAFDRPVTDMSDIRRRMGQVMLAIVFGDGAPTHLIDDIQELFAEVGLRTALIGSRKTAKRDRFYDDLRRLWQGRGSQGEPSLLSSGHDAAAKIDDRFRRDDLLVEQIPHWMFTFTNSGSDLLARSLALIVSRVETLMRVRSEIETSGALSEAGTIQKLRYLEACILEAGRLYPPVAQTVHCAARGTAFEGTEIPAGTELLQMFPFVNRERSRDPLADEFTPERWLDRDDPVHALYPNLFLSGARKCPGRDLILFVDKAALAVLLRGPKMRRTENVLSHDPLPYSFPDECLRF